MRVGMLGFGVLAVMLGGLIAMELAPNAVTARGRAAASLSPPPAPLPSGLGDAKQVEAWVTTVLARPLFEPSRRPPGTATASDPGFPRLAGIVITPDSREAIFAVAGQKEPVVVRMGSRLNGTLIAAIDAGAVTLTDDHGTRRIRPSFDTTTGQRAAAPGAPMMIGLPPSPSGAAAPPFASIRSIRGLSGRPLGLVANPDQPLPHTVGADNPPSLPAPAPSGGSP